MIASDCNLLQYLWAARSRDAVFVRNNSIKVHYPYPNDQPLVIVAGSIVMDINEEWITGIMYLSMDAE
jgi:hypothetical protein